MAFSNYHEKFRQIGTDPNSYESWVDSTALLVGLERLRNLMKLVCPSSSKDGIDRGGVHSSKDCKSNGVGLGALDGTCAFERELSIEFPKNNWITEQNNGTTVVGVTGICDWVGEELKCIKKEGQGYAQDVNLLEIKFVHHLSNVHRLQVLVYSALYVLEVNGMGKHDCDKNEDNSNDEKDHQAKRKIECCKGMLYNARTGETEICSMQASDAMDFLLDICQFKYNGEDRKDLQQKQKSIKDESSLGTTDPNPPQPRKAKMRKKRLNQRNGKSYYTAVCLDDDDGDDDDVTRPKKKQKTVPKGGTDDDPIILD